MSDLKDIMAGLPSYGAEPEAKKEVVPVDETQVQEGAAPVAEEKPAKKAAPSDASRASKKAEEKLPDPATHDYTFGKPIGETGKYKLPNGSVVETY